MSGWIKIHRALLDSPITGDPQALSLWVTILLLANHADQKKLINGKMKTIMAGQLIASRTTLSERTGISESKIDRLLKVFAEDGMVEQLMNSRYRVITVLAWHKYQESEPLVNGSRTAAEPLVSTLEECKEVKEVFKSRAGAKVAKAPVVTECPARVSAQVWEDFTAHRKGLRKPLTELAAQQIAKKLIDHPAPDEVLNQSIANGWAGIFPEKHNGQHQQIAGQGRIDNSAVGRVKAAIAEREAREAAATRLDGSVVGEGR